MNLTKKPTIQVTFAGVRAEAGHGHHSGGDVESTQCCLVMHMVLVVVSHPALWILTSFFSCLYVSSQTDGTEQTLEQHHCGLPLKLASVSKPAFVSLSVSPISVPLHHTHLMAHIDDDDLSY